MERVHNIFTSNYPKLFGKRTMPISESEKLKLNQSGKRLRKYDQTSNAIIYRDKDGEQYAIFKGE